MIGSAILLVIVAGAGCGGSGDLVSASGTVTLDGEPLEGVIVEFQPTDPDRATVFGLTGPNGRYRLRRTAFESGVAPGEYLVRIYCESEDGGANCREAGTEPSRIPARYRWPSELRATVAARGRNRLDFELASD
jgi:hypothetical protein